MNRRALALAGLVAFTASGIGPAQAGTSVEWFKPYDGGSFDSAESLAVSPDGSRVFVTGGSFGSSGTPDYATVSHDAATGRIQWVHRENGSANDWDVASAVAVSPDGASVFVTGEIGSSSTFGDYGTVAYDATSGRRRWWARHNGPGNGFDTAFALAVSPDGSTIFVTGQSFSLRSDYDYATIAYDADTGSKRWERRYNGSGDGFDGAFSVVASPDGLSVFVTGKSLGATSSYDFATVAYRVTTGTRQWVRRYDGKGSAEDSASALAVSPDGTGVFVTGESDGFDLTDFATVAYEAASGDERWVRRYDGSGHMVDRASSIAVSPTGTAVYVTGQSFGAARSFDYTTLAYDAVTGAREWTNRYDGPNNSFESATSLAVNPAGTGVFVTGSSDSDYGTVAYDADSGARLWVRRDGPASSVDNALAIGISPLGTMVFVTGTSRSDYATVAYQAGT